MANNERRLSRFQTLILTGILASQLAACAKAGDNPPKTGTDNGVDNNPKPAEVANGGEIAHAGVMALPVSDFLLESVIITLPEVQALMAAGFVVVSTAGTSLALEGYLQRLCGGYDMVPGGNLDNPYCIKSPANTDPATAALIKAAYAAAMAEAANIGKVADSTVAAITTFQQIDEEIAGQTQRSGEIRTKGEGLNDGRVEIYARVKPRPETNNTKADVAVGAAMIKDGKVIFIVVEGGATIVNRKGYPQVGSAPWWYDPGTFFWKHASVLGVFDPSGKFIPLTAGEGWATWLQIKDRLGLDQPLAVVRLRF